MVAWISSIFGIQILSIIGQCIIDMDISTPEIRYARANKMANFLKMSDSFD
jgi:hypothetical protein